jgi:FtsH-binding integral membrane protein
MSQDQYPYRNQYTTDRPMPGTPGVPTAPGVTVGAATPSALGVIPDPRLANAFLTHAFVWMFAGLLLSAAVAGVVQSNARLLEFASGNFFLLFIAQIAIVMAIAGAINRISATAALALFFVYAATLGVTIGLIVSAYSEASVASAFLSASAMFGAAAVYGAVTKRSLAALGGILFMGLIGLLAAMLINLFLQSSTVSWIVSIIGVGLFTALTAYDVQRIRAGDLAAQTGSMEKAAVIGALKLYLDFINLFLFMLRLMGGRS